MRLSRKQLLWYYGVPVIVWMWVIFLLSSLSGGRTDGGGASLFFILERKGAHVGEYFILALLGLRLLRQFMSLERAIVWTFVGAILYAMSDEYHQLFVPGREGKVTDVMIDFVGIALALLAFAWFRRIRYCTKPDAQSLLEKKERVGFLWKRK